MDKLEIDTPESIAQRLVRIAVSNHFGDLREDMLRDTITDYLKPSGDLPAVLRLADAVSLASLLSYTIWALADELAGVAPDDDIDSIDSLLSDL